MLAALVLILSLALLVGWLTLRLCLCRSEI
jgi:hypothetical protein